MSFAPRQLLSPVNGFTPAPALPMLPVSRAILVSAPTAPAVSVYGPAAGKTMVEGGKPPSGLSALSLRMASSMATGGVRSLWPFWVTGRLLGWVGWGNFSGPELVPPVAYR